jgi:hypothetical protein
MLNVLLGYFISFLGLTIFTPSLYTYIYIVYDGQLSAVLPVTDPMVVLK